MGAVIGTNGSSHEIQPEGKQLHPFLVSVQITFDNIAKYGYGTDDKGQKNGRCKTDETEAVNNGFIKKIFSDIKYTEVFQGTGGRNTFKNFQIV